MLIIVGSFEVISPKNVYVANNLSNLVGLHFVFLIASRKKFVLT